MITVIEATTNDVLTHDECIAFIEWCRYRNFEATKDLIVEWIKNHKK